MAPSWPRCRAEGEPDVPQIEKLLAEAAVADARHGDNPQPATPRALACRAGRRERLARARDRLAAEDTGESKRGQQYQSIVPSVPTSATVRRSPVKPCSAIGR
jgi:hypothetical protein